MAEAKRTGLWATLFPTRSSSCCSVKIEEISDAPQEEPAAQVPDPAGKSDEGASRTSRGDGNTPLAPAPAPGQGRR